MATTKRPATRKTTRKRPAKPSARRKPVARKQLAHRPRGGSVGQRAATWLARFIAKQAKGHRATVQTRKDAAILRATHEGCQKCHGTGTIATHGKDGRLTGSKSCPAVPKTTKVSRAQVARQARFGVDKNSGLMGWKCPCGKNEMPRYRDAKVATAALRTHEKKKHAGVTVGGTWYQQLPETAKAATEKSRPVKPAAPVTKTDTHTTMTDAEWEKQNAPLSPKTAEKKGLCWCCGGKGALYSAFGGDRITAVCGICRGTGKAKTPATA